MSVNGLSFPTMTNKVNILITISTYEAAQPMPIKGETLGLYAIFDRSNQGQPMPIKVNLCQSRSTYANQGAT